MAKTKKPSPPSLTDDNETSKYLVERVDPAFDYIRGPVDAKITLVEYGSYGSTASNAANEIVANLHTRFGDQMRYIFRHLPDYGNETAMEAAVLAEYLSLKSVTFWDIHNELMALGDDLTHDDIERLAREFGFELPPAGDSVWAEAEK